MIGLIQEFSPEARCPTLSDAALSPPDTCFDEDTMGHSGADKNAWTLSPEEPDGVDTSSIGPQELKDFDVRPVSIQSNISPYKGLETHDPEALACGLASWGDSAAVGTTIYPHNAELGENKLVSATTSDTQSTADVKAANAINAIKRDLYSGTYQSLPESWGQSAPQAANPAICTQPSTKSLPQDLTGGQLSQDLASISKTSLFKAQLSNEELSEMMKPSENLTAMNIVLSSKEPLTSFSLTGADNMQQPMAQVTSPDVLYNPYLKSKLLMPEEYLRRCDPPEETFWLGSADKLQTTGGGADDSEIVVVKQEAGQHTPVATDTKRRRKRKRGIPEHELHEEILRKKVKEAEKFDATAPAEAGKKERRRKQNREAAERCRKKKKEESGEMQKEKDRLEKENKEIEAEVALLKKQKADLEAILASDRCFDVPGNILAMWRAELMARPDPT